MAVTMAEITKLRKISVNSKVSITKDFFQNSLFNFQGPARDIRGYSSAGRAPALQAGGQRFDPAYLHHEKQQLFNNGLRNNEPNQYGLIAQPVRAHA